MQKLLGKSSGVKASAKGIISVSESGEESLVEAPVKKPRGRPRKTPIVEVMDDSPEPDAAPPSKRLRARSRMSVDTEGGDSAYGSIVATPEPGPIVEIPVRRKPGRPRKTATKSEAESASEAEVVEAPVSLISSACMQS